MSYDLSGYVDVAERVQQFFGKYPDGSLQAEAVFTNEGWQVVAFAYRTPDDPRPGIGHSYLQVPGKTSFTRDSELENAETSAWGRALAALGFAPKKIASADEVRMRHNSGEPSRTPTDSDPGPSVKVDTSPRSTEASPENPAAKAQAAAEKAKAARAPEDNGIPSNVVLHWGTPKFDYKGQRLGELPPRALKFLAEKWTPKDDPQDRRLKLAAQALLAGDDTSDFDIPF